jgi:hypothetical protein
MADPIDRKLVIAVSSSALFDLNDSDRVFREKGEKAYKAHQEENLDVILEKGAAFPFVRRFLSINELNLTPASAAAKSGRKFASFCKFCDAFYGRLEAIVILFYLNKFNIKIQQAL